MIFLIYKFNADMYKTGYELHDNTYGNPIFSNRPQFLRQNIPAHGDRKTVSFSYLNLPYHDGHIDATTSLLFVVFGVSHHFTPRVSWKQRNYDSHDIIYLLKISLLKQPKRNSRELTWRNHYSCEESFFSRWCRFHTKSTIDVQYEGDSSKK